MPGVPDVMVCDEDGRFHFIELKATASRVVDLRPHQVAWLSTHAHASVWILVRKIKTKTLPEQIFLYPGSAAMDLRFDGLKVEPLYQSEGKPDWETILSLICPRESHRIP